MSALYFIRQKNKPRFIETKLQSNNKDTAENPLVNKSTKERIKVKNKDHDKYKVESKGCFSAFELETLLIFSYSSVALAKTSSLSFVRTDWYSTVWPLASLMGVTNALT